MPGLAWIRPGRIKKTGGPVVKAVQPTGVMVFNPAVGCHYFQPGRRLLSSHPHSAEDHRPFV